MAEYGDYIENGWQPQTWGMHSLRHVWGCGLFLSKRRVCRPGAAGLKTRRSHYMLNKKTKRTHFTANA